MNFSVRLTQKQAEMVAETHRGLWKFAVPKKLIMQTVRNLTPLKGTLYQANDVGARALEQGEVRTARS
jgi:hypothetical protein